MNWLPGIHRWCVAGRAWPRVVLLAGLVAACSEGEPTPGHVEQEPAPEAARAPQPLARNVVLVVVDTLRADRLGCYGYPRGTSPSIDAWAEGGTLYEDSRGQGAWTRPSMISMMSGSYVTALEELVPPELPTLAEVISESGKATVAMVGNKILVGDRGFQRGFDEFEGPKVRSVAQGIFRQFYEWYGRNEADLDEGPGFFAWLHVMDPHTPRNPSPKHRAALTGPDPMAEQLMAEWAKFDLGPNGRNAAPGKLSFDEATAEMLEDRSDYDAAVRGLDESFATLLAFLEKQGELEDTLVILTSDHGEELYQLPRVPQELRRMRRLGGLKRNVKDLVSFGHGSTFQEEIWHLPLIFVGPGFPAGERREGLAANLDIFPTILEALGVAAPDHLAGGSLSGGATPDREQVFGFTHGMLAVKDARGLKLVDRTDWRDYKRFEAADRDDAADGSPLELYDLNDPNGDAINVAAERDREVRFLSEALARWKAQHGRKITESGISERDLEALRELGYLGDDG